MFLPSMCDRVRRSTVEMASSVEQLVLYADFRGSKSARS